MYYDLINDSGEVKNRIKLCDNRGLCLKSSNMSGSNTRRRNWRWSAFFYVLALVCFDLTSAQSSKGGKTKPFLLFYIANVLIGANTDLGSLIGNIDSGFSDFPDTLILLENDFG